MTIPGRVFDGQPTPGVTHGQVIDCDHAHHELAVSHRNEWMAGCLLIVSNLKHILHIILSQYRLPVDGIHGIAHWGRVLESGRRLAPLTGADPRVLEYFSILHDSRRQSEGRDPAHGERAAALARELRAEIDLEDGAFALLVESCSCHTRGAAARADITIQSCLDADRLDIPRVGMRIKTELLHTNAARDPEIILWASDRAARWVTPAVASDEWG